MNMGFVYGMISNFYLILSPGYRDAGEGHRGTTTHCQGETESRDWWKEETTSSRGRKEIT